MSTYQEDRDAAWTELSFVGSEIGGELIGPAIRGIGGLFRGANIIGEESSTIYRVVSTGEASDVLANGFRQAPIASKISSYEGKLFWTNLENANWYHNWVGEGNQILEINVNKSFIFEHGADAGRPFLFVSPEKLDLFNSAIRSIK